ncbi:helix-turn-helix transcriptional regulator [Actinophytocola sediminis]
MGTVRHPLVRKYLRAARNERDMTQKDVADAVGAVRNTIGKLETGIAIDEGIEAAVEKLFGWPIGSLDRLRAGQELIIPSAPERGIQVRNDDERRFAEFMIDAEYTAEEINEHLQLRREYKRKQNEIRIVHQGDSATK